MTILYTRKERTPFRENVSPAQLSACASALTSEGYRVETVEFSPRSGLSRLRDSSPDVVLNLAYGWTSRTGRSQYTQAEVAALAERAGGAIVGAAASAQRTAQDKVATAVVAHACGISTPVIIDPTERKRPRRAVLKPRHGASHRDVHIVDPSRIGQVDTSAWLLQEYIDGKEYTVGVLVIDGRIKVLPPIEVVFDRRIAVMDWTKHQWRLCVRAEQRRSFAAAARRLFAGLELRDYARLDFRVTKGEPVLLDANALPGLDPVDSFLPLAARAAGISYQRLIRGLVRSALLRGPAYAP